MALMKKLFRGIVIGAGIFIALIAVFLLVLTAYHRISLFVERDGIMPIGHLVEVNSNEMHVYIEGENKDTPLLVFLSGFGTSAPVYDFKPLFSLLSGEYRIAVVEKFGYGYSDIVDVPRDIDSMLADTRAALSLLGETGPFVLAPHSMSGVEAIRWAQLYPDEVLGIIAIDAGLPSFFVSESEFYATQVGVMRVLSVLTWMGFHRFPFIAPVGDWGLTEEEFAQARLLSFRNEVNRTMMIEIHALIENAHLVAEAGVPDVPILLLVANDQAQLEATPTWIPYKEEFARLNRAEFIIIDANHYLHRYEPEQIAELSRKFIRSIIDKHDD